ncbi:MAG TPA: mucoidy inhibitor MuiA family protein [Polyangia bacterium]|jgi:uncharacterized protein (TIGR02231 family)
MRPLLRLLAAPLLLLASVATAQAPGPQRVSGKVDAVTVFSDRALVRRVQALVPTHASGVLRFHSLPVALVRESVRASGRGVTITSVAVRPTAPTSDREWLDHPLRLELDRIDQKIQAESDKIATYNEQLRLLGSLGAMTTAQSDRELRLGSIRTDGWKSAVDFLEEKREAYQAKIRAVGIVLQRLQRERGDAANKLNEAMLARRRSPVEVEVGYAGRPGASADVTLEYTVTNVSWTPLYDLRGSAEGGAFHLVSNANIRQTSGETWENVKVTLSTARPAVGTAPGMLQPWRLSQRSLTPPVGNTQRKQYGGDADGSSGASDAGAAGGSTTMTVQLPGRETIASDSADHRVVLKSSKLPGTLAHVAIPSLTQQVYLRARLNNSSGMPLLGGGIAVFLDGNFVGTSAFGHLAAAGEDFDIYLGPDQRLQVKRTLLRGDVEGSGFFSKKVTVKNQWQIEIANYSGKSRQVIVLDQYPVSADPSIESGFAGSSRSLDRRDANGLLTWKLDVPQGKRETFDFSYALTVPREMWDRLEQQAMQQQLAEERQKAQGQAAHGADYNFAPASPAPAMPAKAKRMYNLEMMMNRR